jgi:N-acetyl-anhydromuramyl-L-alanine amidase AmpD
MMQNRQPSDLRDPGPPRFSRGCALALLAAALLNLLLAGLSGKLNLDWRRLWMQRPHGIILHHTATPDVVEGKRVDAAFIGREHARRGFSTTVGARNIHIGYHYLILRDGTVQPGRPEDVPGSHTLGHNDQLGICLVGNFSSGANPHGEHGSTQPSRQQLAALDRLLKQLIDKYHYRPKHLHRHRDYAPTACPGDRFPFEDVKRRAFGR